jgi:hypothetical protein
MSENTGTIVKRRDGNKNNDDDETATTTATTTTRDPGRRRPSYLETKFQTYFTLLRVFRSLTNFVFIYDDRDSDYLDY